MGIMSAEQNLKDWYSRDPKLGMGRRFCEHLTPATEVTAAFQPYDISLFQSVVLPKACVCVHTQVDTCMCTGQFWVASIGNVLSSTPCALELSAMSQVRHRCHCTNATLCGEEAKLVERYARLGLLTPNNGAALAAYEASLSHTNQMEKPTVRR